MSHSAATAIPTPFVQHCRQQRPGGGRCVDPFLGSHGRSFSLSTGIPPVPCLAGHSQRRLAVPHRTESCLGKSGNHEPERGSLVSAFQPASWPRSRVLELAAARVRMIAATWVRVGTTHRLPAPPRPMARPSNNLTVDRTSLHCLPFLSPILLRAARSSRDSDTYLYTSAARFFGDARRPSGPHLDVGQALRS